MILKCLYNFKYNIIVYRLCAVSLLYVFVHLIHCRLTTDFYTDFYCDDHNTITHRVQDMYDIRE